MNSSRKGILLLILLACCSLGNASEETCSSLSFSYNKLKKKESLNLLLCRRDKLKQPVIFSKNCRLGKCSGVKKLREEKISNARIYEDSKASSPQFKKCHLLGGFPLRGKLSKLLTNRKTMLCFFNEDNSVLNTEALFLWDK